MRALHPGEYHGLGAMREGPPGIRASGVVENPILAGLNLYWVSRVVLPALNAPYIFDTAA
jgi:hypothetical protein